MSMILFIVNLSGVRGGPHMNDPEAEPTKGG